MAGSRDPVRAELAKLNPAKVKVYLAGGADPVELAVTERRQKWNLLMKSLGAYPNWLRLEAVRKDGAVIGVVNNPEADDEDLNDLTEGMDRVDDELYRAVGNQSKLFLKGIEIALKSTNKHQEQLVGQVVKAVEVITDSVLTLGQLQREYLQHHMAMAVAGDGAALQSDALMEKLAPILLQKLLEKSPKQLAAAASAAKANKGNST